MKALLVAATAVVASFVSSSAALIQVMGAFAAALASFVLPAIVYLCIRPMPIWWEMVLTVALAAFGALGILQACL